MPHITWASTMVQKTGAAPQTSRVGTDVTGVIPTGRTERSITAFSRDHLPELTRPKIAIS